MIQSAFGNPRHVAIIMDGNGRWATRRGRPRSAGHRAGAKAVRRVIEAAPGLGIRHLTLYAFSADNWKRPRAEVRALMRLFRVYLSGERARCVREGVRVRVIGRRDRLDGEIVAEIERTEQATSHCSTLDLRLAVDYSGRDAIVAAAARAALSGGVAERPAFARLLADALHAGDPVPDVDLLIRTGGDRRLSDFLPWESAYAELFFTDTEWPDFGEEELARAVGEYRVRERRFGGLGTGAGAMPYEAAQSAPVSHERQPEVWTAP